MTGQPKKYQRQKHINAILKKSGAKYSVQAILMAMCSQSEFDRPMVTITKKQICHLIGGLHRIYIIRGLRTLEELGVIEVIANGQGGRGVAPTYLLKRPPVDQKPEDIEEPTQNRLTADERKKFADQTMKNFGFKTYG